MRFSKREKQKNKLLHKEPISSEEMIRLLELKGWYPDPNNPQSGSHKQFVNPETATKVTVPTGRKNLPKGTRDAIINQAGLTGD